MTPAGHVVISAATGGIFLYSTHSWAGAVACFFSGIFIDLDHHLDFYLEKGKIPLRYSELLYFCEKEKTGKLYLFFHSYELLALFWLLIMFLHLGYFWSGLALGLTTHLIADQIFNPLKPLGYFLIYRIRNDFDKAKIFVDDFYHSLK